MLCDGKANSARPTAQGQQRKANSAQNGKLATKRKVGIPHIFSLMEDMSAVTLASCCLQQIQNGKLAHKMES